MELERFRPGVRSDGELQAQHLSRYEFAAKYAPGKKIIDVACGTGYGSALLLRQGAIQVTGIDLSGAAIDYAQRHYSLKGLTFIRGDVSILRSAVPSDCIVSFETIEHLENPDALLLPVREVLSPDGLFIVSTPVRHGGLLTDRPANPYHIREWNEEEFDALLSRYFSVRNFYFQYVYRKRAYPFSRRINRFALSLFHPGVSKGFAVFPVVGEPWDVPGYLVDSGYMIAVCSGRAG